uniref:Uncharacterized protein n=1 Tax=Oryza brachyantha TaxID=4533 RepID=J3LUG4_ORYBR
MAVASNRSCIVSGLIILDSVYNCNFSVDAERDKLTTLVISHHHLPVLLNF